MKRRDLLRHGGWLAGASLLALRSGWALASQQPAQQRMVVVFLRGAVDGLSVLAPYGDSNYYSLRDSIALARPGSDGGLIDLDGYFGLHPALGGLLPLWQAGQLAFVPASGSPDPSRSHFDAQDFMESGTPGNKNTPDGWLNRLLAQLPPHTPAQALSVGDTLPRIFRGDQTVATMAYGKGAAKPMAVDRPKFGEAFDRLYSADDALGRAYREGRVAHSEIMASMDDSGQDKMANNGAPDAKGFVLDAQNLGQLLRRDARVQLAFIAAGGWDTHVNQGNAKGQLADRLQALGDGLNALATSLGSDWQNTVVVVMSEFGRTAHENGNRGTDHGHGNTMWVLGGGVQGGRIYSDWPGLDSGALYEGRDLAVTTDFRAVLAQVLGPHFNLPDRELARLFPDMPHHQRHYPLLRA